ncbi:MAG: hypothetical protein SFW64_08710 [Alphaproteobacteria bacterium]|nr:hypothetical protein [Alphaproteobacteria bacterium]
MVKLNLTETLDTGAAEAYKARATRAKFKQQVSYGIGAAMVFGLVTALAGGLREMAFGEAVGAAATTAAGAAASSTLLPILGLVALGALGVGLLYLSAQYLSENTLLDQALQARQIGVATRGHAPKIEPEVEAKPTLFPAAGALAAAPSAMEQENAPLPRVLADTVAMQGMTQENAAPTQVRT